MMTPQLFINYKMKSVAHLPWRMMTYKALNTFIDDLCRICHQNANIVPDWMFSEMILCSSFTCISDGSIPLILNV
ncbi:Cleft lip and palate transmembrane protein 1 like protein [Desmophyllum pertusum]|uniref:Cleft lip and palate transmembrane protein 1 like protein n=1 Tax=Desmophyllum pertusum TaxID=174260 RepID=A0A9W9ZLZ8_9CNID|nr:Cleft lip and palate transmembrane protein 1 like protein [Desmophyllum pertusum]